ncbi:MAG: thiazole synthase, partial [Alphaproteobacteria bacterium]|nr:thiazole synthase [Alphaproteobacteria bacterium]
LLNTAVAKAIDPVIMADAFAGSIQSGRKAYLAGIITPQEKATASTPLLDRPFWHQE